MFNLISMAKAFLLSLMTELSKSFSRPVMPFADKSVAIIGGADGPTRIFVAGGGNALGHYQIGVSNMFSVGGLVWMMFSAALTFIIVYNMVKKYK